MTYTYTYRDEKGAVRTGTVEAANRAALFSELKRRGVSPLSVREGSGKAVSREASGVSRKTVWGVLAGIALIGTLALVFVGRTGSASPEKNVSMKKDRSAVAKEKAGSRKMSEIHTVHPIANKSLVSPAKPATTNVITPEVQIPELPSIGTNLPPQGALLPPPTFETASDQVIAMALQADEHGMAPMPLSKDLEREFLESLKKDIEILETDDEQTRALKESVRATRAEIKKLIGEGMSFNQVMQEHQKLVNENAKIRDDATLELKKILDAGDIEGAKAYKRKINLALEQMGIKGLSIAVTEEERAERAAARRERMLERRARQAAQAETAAALKAAQDGR